MKHTKHLLLAVLSIITTGTLMAQEWTIGGDPNAEVPAAGGQFGTNGNRAIIFKTNNVERARLLNTSGFWGFGTAAPNARVHVNGAVDETPFRVQINGSSKLYVNSNGGVAVGSSSTPPANGLYVSGNTGIGTSLPDAELHVFRGSAGTVTGHTNAPLVIENSTNGYINLLTPAANESGILFGNPGSNVDGGIIYVGSVDALQFRTNGNTTRMTLSNTGNLDIVGGALSFGSVETLNDNGSNTIGSNSTLVPTTDNSRDLGTSSLRWNEVWAVDGTINTSDARDKKNIEDLKYGLKEIMQLRPVKFKWNNPAADYDKFGVIAQEIQKVLPQVVKDHEYVANEATGALEKVPAARLGVMYADIIPVLIKGMQEQQKIIETLMARVDQLESNPIATSASKSSASTTDAGALLEQNTPNPFNQATTIRYRVPDASAAAIVIYNSGGVPVKNIRANASGMATINAGELAAGTYNYSLVVNGKVVSSRKMVLIK